MGRPQGSALDVGIPAWADQDSWSCLGSASSSGPWPRQCTQWEAFERAALCSKLRGSEATGTQPQHSSFSVY